MILRRALIPTAILLSSSVCLGLASAAGDAQPVRQPVAACRTEKAIGLPSWTVEGLWRDDRTLMLIDAVNQKPVEVSNSAMAIQRPGALTAYLQDVGTVGIRKGTLRGDKQPRRLVEVAGGFIPLDAPRSRIEFALASRSNAEPRIGDNDNRVDALQDWVLVDGDVVGYADVVEGTGASINQWKNGFVRFPLNHASDYRIVRERNFPDSLRPAFRLTYPMLAGLGSAAYTLVVDGEMGIWRLDRNDQDLVKLQAFPAHLQNKLGPNLWDWAHPDEFPRLMQEVEKATMPTGIYSWDNALFVVSRTLESGQRKWFLTKIDPVEDKVLWTVPIRSKAHHLTVIPGPKEWAFLEKGPVNRLSDQRTEQILYVASAEMRAPKLAALCQ